jgi:Ca2+-binding RTX toxin-like protein
MRSVTATGRSATGAARPDAKPLPVGRRRRIGAGSATGATLSAAFLGLLLGEAIAGEQRGDADAARALPSERDADVGEGGAVGGGRVPTAAASNGVLLTASATPGDVDLTTLTAVSDEAAPRAQGEAVVASGGDEARLVTLRDAPAAPAGLPPGAAPSADLTLALDDGDGPPPPPLPDDDDDLGPIGIVDDGTDGDDTLIGTDRDDLLDGGDGDDLIYGGNGNDSLLGGNGNDTIFGGNGNDYIDGGNGDDLLYGDAGDDLIAGGAGNDRIYGGLGDDSLYGGSGDDRIDGGLGRDTLYGGTGRDVLVVDNLHDLALENPWGADGGGLDTLEVRPGFAQSLRDALPHLAPDGRATFVLGDQVGVTVPPGAVAWTQQVNAHIENVRLLGDTAHDVLGDGRANTLIGNAGDNRLYGGGGDDVLRGGEGDDWLVGGDGDDLLYGEAGDDVYVLGLSDTGVDTVFDHSGANRLVVQGANPAQLTATVVGTDLHLAQGGRTFAVIKDYVGYESSFAGIDLGQGLRPLADFIARPPELASVQAPRPDQVGTAGNDLLQARSGGEWLAGRGGDDTLLGGDGNDRLEGGAGNDVLRGGKGDDTYVVGGPGGGIDRINDSEGRNTIEVVAAEGKQLGAYLLGRDLWLTVDDTPVAVVERYDLHRESWASIRAGERVVDPHELLT